MILLVDAAERTRTSRAGEAGARQLIDTLRVHAAGTIGVVVTTLRKSADVVLARVDARADAPRTADGASGVECVETAMREVVATTLDVRALVADPVADYLQPLLHVERKSLLDAAGSFTGASDVPAAEHLSEQVADGVAFARATGSRFALLIEGFQQATATDAPVGALSVAYVRARLARIQALTQTCIAQTTSIDESALVLLEWARALSVPEARPLPYLGFDDATYVASPHVVVRKSGANDEPRTWFLNVMMRTFNGLDSAAPVVADALGNSIESAVDRLRALPSRAARIAFIADLRSPVGRRQRVGDAVASRIVDRFIARDAVEDEESCGMNTKAKRRRQ